MKFKFSAGIIAVFSAFSQMFSACGDDSGSSANDELPESVELFVDMKNIECNADRECAQVYIEEHDDYVQCIDSKWKTVIASKPNEACAEAKSSSSKGKSSSSEKKQSSSSVNNSSSSVKSSSSRAKSSSSIPLVDPSTVVKGSMIDERDGKTYKTVTIGQQTWMAENLNYDYDYGTAQSYCYKNDPDSCAKYGRYYTWSAVLDSAAVFSNARKGYGYKSYGGEKISIYYTNAARGVCPSGWHVPDTLEWTSLIMAVGGHDSAGVKLKANSGWLDGNGSDSFGFASLPSGFVNEGSFYDGGLRAFFWTSFSWNSEYGVVYVMEDTTGKVKRWTNYKYKGAPVRCIKDSNNKVVSSSSYVPSSSSNAKSSSSVQQGPDESEYDAEKEILIDFRDNQKYKTTEAVQKLIWMTTNLNYDYNVGTAKSYCYKNYDCRYGRLYTWAAAMDSAAVFSDAGKGCGYNKTCNTSGFIRGACPKGWHLPDSSEWNTLLMLYEPGRKLKSETGWGRLGGGFNKYNFDVRPGGLRNYDGSYFGSSISDNSANGDSHAYFWSSFEVYDKGAYGYHFYSQSYGVEKLRSNKYYGYSVRCVKDYERIASSSSSED